MLYSYALRTDDGAAPNPYGGVCTLAICKPKIRRAAKVGDWIVALGTTTAPDGRDLSRHVVCAMKVTAKLTFAQYDQWCKAELPTKLPRWSKDATLEELVGDCIYFYDGKHVRQRKGVHDKEHMARDLRGEYVLLSDEYFYFGDNAVQLPLGLQGIRHPWVGHRSHTNADYESSVVRWLKNGCGAGWEMGKVHGRPLHAHLVEEAARYAGNQRMCSPCSPDAIRPPSCSSSPIC